MPYHEQVIVYRDQLYHEVWRLEYPDFMALPERTRVNVAALRMYAANEKVPGLGRRVSDTTFWLDDSPELLEEYGDVV